MATDKDEKNTQDTEKETATQAKTEQAPAPKPADQQPNEAPETPATPAPKPADQAANKTATKPRGSKAKAKTATKQEEDSEAKQAIAPAIEGVEENPEVKARVRQALAHAGDTPTPTMVNGKSVAGKVYDEKTDKWVDDPDTVAPAVRAADIFDRIGEAFPHETQRLVIEEIARFAGMGEDETDLPEGMPALKSTASLRTDVSGHGRFTGGGPGVKPVPVGTDGKAQVE